MGQLKRFVDQDEMIKFLRNENRGLRKELADKEQIIQAQAKTIQELGGYDNREEALSSAE